MKWVALLLQLVSFRSSLLESRALLENARAAAEKGKRAALFSAFVLLATVYFLAGTILLAIEMGLQVDRGEFFRFSGLFGSGLALLVLAFLIVGISALGIGGGSTSKAEEPPPRDQAIKGLLEEFLVTFLGQVTNKLKDGKRE